MERHTKEGNAHCEGVYATPEGAPSDPTRCPHTPPPDLSLRPSAARTSTVEDPPADVVAGTLVIEHELADRAGEL
ncbi:MAG: hypothetical protein ABI112_06710, partial [Terracoccus sp.]